MAKTSEADAKVKAPRAGKTKTTKSYAAPALEKGLDVLELLARQPSGLTKSQLARELDRTVSEIFRMLVCLEERGYIAQLAEDRYSLTLKLFQLVQEHPPTERLLVEALPVMDHLAHVTKQSCHMGVLELGNVSILAQVNPPTRIGFYVKLGSTVDIMDSASGYVILAHQSEVQLERILEEWRRETDKKAPRDLHTHLNRIRKLGYEKRASYEVKGVINISFPILNQHGWAIGALTIPHIQYSSSSLKMSDVVEELRKAAAEITEKLGGKRPEAA
ncbi:helix-turn-helix domain-containing protein [Granulicella sp. 5B5]|uniref:IclR family transcriptional regulator n=1 Tax=Granulicella sp. 5B5 TaxID=1617967 RepID=UPI0015F6871B|nr:IclR family transcriptional regulator [Granulicella sp. 5B5]QMV19393.1 helix-turn-helix domain-containing protein [Granulicella sp. 5B5]